MIGAKKRFEVLKRDNFTCQYCGKKSVDVTLEIDHVIPKSKGGTDDFSNLVTSCRECNLGKGQTQLAEWDSKFNIKVKDLFNYIKSEFYRIRNEGIHGQEEYKKKKIDGTIEFKTMSLMASFLQWWIDYRIKTPQKIRDLINDKIETMKRMEESGTKRGYEDMYISNHPTIVKIREDSSLIDSKISEFYEGGDFFDELTQDFAGDFIANDCIFDIAYQDDRWNTNDMDKRLNYTISLNINEFGGVPSWILRKYSLYPNAKREW